MVTSAVPMPCNKRYTLQQFFGNVIWVDILVPMPCNKRYTLQQRPTPNETEAQNLRHGTQCNQVYKLWRRFSASMEPA